MVVVKEEVVAPCATNVSVLKKNSADPGERTPPSLCCLSLLLLLLLHSTERRAYTVDEMRSSVDAQIGS